MQSNEETRLDQQAPDEASATMADAEPRKPGRPKGSKNVGKKKASKKKAGKKKASSKTASRKKAGKKKSGKKKASKKKVSRSAVAELGLGKKATRKKAGKKKASKKKRGKKKAAASRAGGSDSMARLMAAVEELREAVVELAQSKASEQHTAVHELREAAKAKIADLEDAAMRSFKKLGF